MVGWYSSYKARKEGTASVVRGECGLMGLGRNSDSDYGVLGVGVGVGVGR